VALGLALLALCVPLVGRPLYDGVVVTEPYEFLHPGPGEAGDPASFSEVFDVIGGESPILSAGTGESPPQASVYGNQGDLIVGSTTTSIKIGIDPIEPPDQPKDGNLAGNVYDISVTDQLGMPVVPTPGGGFSVVLRQPEDISGKATMALFVDGEWRFVESSDAGSRGFYVSTPPELGIFALIVGAGHLSSVPPYAPPTPAATVVTTVGPSNGRPTVQETLTSTPIALEVPSQPSAQPTPPPSVASSTSPTEPSSTSLTVAAGLVLLALAALAAAIALPRLSRRG